MKDFLISLVAAWCIICGVFMAVMIVSIPISGCISGTVIGKPFAIGGSCSK